MRPNPQIKSYPSSIFVPKELVHLHDVDAPRTRELAYKISEQVFENLRLALPYVYMTSGITEALDWVLPRFNVSMRSDDYRYAWLYSHRQNCPPMTYVSYPFAGNGSFVPIPEDDNVFLDCAYLFASNLQCVRSLPPQVNYAAFSLSKGHNLASSRIGWLFSKKPLLPQHLAQYDYGYICNRHAIYLEISLGQPLNLLYTLYKGYLKDLYVKKGLKESDTNLFGLDEQGKRHPWWTL